MDDPTQVLAGLAAIGLVLMGLIKLTHDAVYGDKEVRVKIALCLAVAALVVFVGAHSDFAHQTEIMGKRLDAVNLATQIFFVFIVAGTAVTFWTGLGQLGNIGENKADKQTVATSK